MLIRMDQATEEDWLRIRKAGALHQAAMPERLKTMLLQLDGFNDGHEITQLGHALQTASRALRGGASSQMIVAALCHDIGHTITIANHAAIAAEILMPFVSDDIYKVVATHDIFAGKYSYASIGKNPDAREIFRDEAWYESACTFAEWDQLSFDPDYKSLSLSDFEPYLQHLFAEVKPGFWSAELTAQPPYRLYQR